MVGFDASLLTAFFAAQTNQAALRTANVAAPSSASADNEADPPWSINVEQKTDEEQRARALSGKGIIDDTVKLYEDADPDDANLFTMYVALDRLKAIADFAAEKSTAAFRLSSLDRSFQEGLAEIQDFLGKTSFQQLDVLYGESRRKAESEAGVQRYIAEYTTNTVVSGNFDDAVSGLTGTEQFSLIAKKVNSTVQVDFDLSQVSGPLTLDNLVDYFNTQLEAAGLVTRFERVKIGDENEDGIVEGNNFGFKIRGSTTETVRFEAAASAPALYIAGQSGSGDNASGQVTKLSDLAGGTPTIDFSKRLEAEGEIETKTFGEDLTLTTEEPAPLNIADSAIDSQGNLYVVAQAAGDVNGRTVSGDSEVILTKYDSTGQVVWTRQVGSNGSAEGFAVAVDSDDNVVIAGSTEIDLTDNVLGGGKDSFVIKYASNGEEQWTYQRGPTADDEALGLATGPAGEIYVVGQTKARLSSAQTYGGAGDGYLIALDANGNRTYERQIGGATADKAVSVAVASDGNLLVASVEDGQAVVRKFDGADATGAALWERNLGDLQGGALGDLVVDGTDIYLAGYTTNGSLSGPIANAASGGDDGFVAKLSDAGAVDFISYVGTGEEDRIASVAVDNGTIYVAGQTRGTLPGATQSGTTDSFAAELNSSGALQWATQYGGRGGVSKGASIQVASNGSSVLDVLGLPTGNAVYAPDRSVAGGTAVRDGQYFYISVDGGAKRKITIDGDDSMRQLAFDIDRVLLLNGDAGVRKGGGVDRLQITPKEGVKIELIRGEGEFDALAGLGLQPGTIFDDGGFLAEDDETDDADEIKTYALGITDAISLSDKKLAEAAAELLSEAMLEITRAHREVNTDPALKALLDGQANANGPVPSYLTSQLANYQAGLDRLNAGGSAGQSAGLFF